jgi:hypothetical protein
MIGVLCAIVFSNPGLYNAAMAPLRLSQVRDYAARYEGGASPACANVPSTEVGRGVSIRLLNRTFSDRAVLVLDNRSNARFMLDHADIHESRDNFQRTVSGDDAYQVLIPPGVTVVELPLRFSEHAKRVWLELRVTLTQEDAAEKKPVMVSELIYRM